MGTRKEEAQKLLEHGEPNDVVLVIVWTTQDVIDHAKNMGYELTEEEAEYILETLGLAGNADEGVTWDTIGAQIQFEKEKKIPHLSLKKNIF